MDKKRLNKNKDSSDSINKKKIIKNDEKKLIDKVTDINEVQKVVKNKVKKKKFLEKKENFKNKMEQVNTKRIKVILIISVLVIIFAVAICLTMVKNIEIDEGKSYTKDEVKGLVFKNILDYNTIYLFLKYRYSEQKEIPFLEEIDVQWKDKNSIKIKVYDKNIIGCTNYMNEYIYFDKDGYVVETSQKKQEETPYITGIRFKELTLNKKISVSDDKVFDIILSVTQQISKYKLKIDEINFDKNYNITLYSDDITILLGKKDAYDEQLAKLRNLLKEAKHNNLSGVMHMENYKEGQDRIIFDKNN